MLAVEYWARVIRLAFVIVLSIVGYQTLMRVATGWQHTFWIVMFFPFIITTLIVEFLQLITLLRRKRQTHT